MKQIINGKKYNTETAAELANHNEYYGSGDFRSMNETLYRKKTGEFFLAGCGGPMTRYAESMGHGWISGEKIIPLTVNEAKKWTEQYCSCDEYEAIFGEAEE